MQIEARLIQNIDELQVLVDALMQLEGPVGFDIETGYTGPGFKNRATCPEAAEISGFSLANSITNGWYIPLRHAKSENLDPESTAEIMRPLLLSGRIVCHNAKFEIRFCERKVEQGGMDCNFSPLADTMLESYVLQLTPKHGLKDLSKSFLGHEMNELGNLFCDFYGVEKLTAKYLNMINCHDLQTSTKLTSYGVEDSAVALALHEKFYPKVKDSFIFKLEMNLLPVCVAMERVGIRYDWQMLIDEVAKNEEFQSRMYEEVVKAFEEGSGKEYVKVGDNKLNLASSKSMADVIYLDYGIPITEVTPKGSPKVDAATLQPYAEEHKPIEKYLEYKALNTAKNSFLIKYPKDYRDAADDRAHPSMLQHGTYTGRFAIKDPPYHSTPGEKVYTLVDGAEYSFNFKKSIIAEPGWYFLYYDLAQAELRALAGEAGDTDMIEALNAGVDMHERTASMMLRKPVEEVSREDRDKGKTINFAQIYGRTDRSLARVLGLTELEAKGLLEAFYAAMPAVKLWQDGARKEAEETHYSRSRFGRRHSIWEFQSSRMYHRALRVAINAPIQGAIGDYMKLAMVRAYRKIHNTGMEEQVRLIMNNHDSLTFEVRDNLHPFEVVDMLTPEVTFPIDGWPTMVAEWAVGRRWGELVDLEEEHRSMDLLSILLTSSDFERDEDLQMYEDLQLSEANPPSSYVPDLDQGPEVTNVTPSTVIIDFPGFETSEQAVHLKALLAQGHDKVRIRLRGSGQEVIADNVKCPKELWPEIRTLLGPDTTVYADVDSLQIEEVLQIGGS